MRTIPDCPPNMGNANDWIKAREALGFPQNRIVSYEYTTYENSDSDAVELLQQAHKEANEHADEMYNIGFDEGYVAGYKQAAIDVEKCLETNLYPKEVKKALNKTNNYLPVRDRNEMLTDLFQKFQECLNPNIRFVPAKQLQKKNKKS